MKQLMSYPVVLESWESVQGNQNATTFDALVDSMRKNVHRSHGCLLVIELERGVLFVLIWSPKSEICEDRYKKLHILDCGPRCTSWIYYICMCFGPLA